MVPEMGPGPQALRGLKSRSNILFLKLAVTYVNESNRSPLRPCQAAGPSCALLRRISDQIDLSEAMQRPDHDRMNQALRGKLEQLGVP